METEEKIVTKIVEFIYTPERERYLDIFKSDIIKLLKEFKKEILKSAAHHSNHHIDHLRF